MITSSTVAIDAPADLVWNVFADVEHWPQWTPSVTRLIGLDGSELAVGRRFQIDQPRMPRLVWTVTEITPHRSWTWVQRSPGGLTTARHDVVETAPDATVVTQSLEQRGIIGAAVGLVLRNMTCRYLAMEARGLKSRSEGVWELRGTGD